MNNMCNERIEYILDNFDFERVKTIMKTLNWKWYRNGEERYPTYNELRATAKRLLQNATEEGTTASCSGGFRASLSYEVLELAFMVTWEDDTCFEEDTLETVT